MEIGKNDPCPCGSGLNYRYCCWGDKEPEDFFWHKENIEQYSSEKIMSLLFEIGIEITKEEFKNAAQKYDSASELAKHWSKKNNIELEDNFQEFPNNAIEILWERIIDDKKAKEELTNKIEAAQELLEEERYSDYCEEGLEVWEDLKLWLDSENLEDIRAVDRSFRTKNTFFNWCQKLELNLFKAGEEDQKFYKKRIQYCQDFVNLLPDSPEFIIKNMKRAEAESHYKIDEVEEGDEKFQQLVNDHPNWVWSYLGWGDMYALELEIPLIAKKIYEMALEIRLENGAESREKVKERLAVFNDTQLTEDDSMESQEFSDKS